MGSIVYSAHASWLAPTAPLGRASRGGRSALPRHVPCLGEQFTTAVIPAKSGIQSHHEAGNALRDGFQPSLE